jgi:hypothetical protein
MRSLNDRLDSYAEAWRPKPGDKLIGVIVDLDERASEYDEDPYPIVTVERDDDGREVAWHAYHTVARNELAKQRPQRGDRIGIAYHGKPDGKSYESYRIIVEPAEPQANEIDWDKHRTDNETEQDVELDDETLRGATGDDPIPF